MVTVAKTEPLPEDRTAIMDRRVALLNIAHFKERLKDAVDDAKRRRLTALLHEEEAKLEATVKQRRQGSKKT